MSNIFGYDSSFGGQSSSSSSNGLFGVNLVDYASIRNGSYRKLVTAHYKNIEEEEGKSSSSSASGVKDSKQTLTSISDAAAELKDAASNVRSLFKTTQTGRGYSQVDYDTDEMYSAVKDFVKSYNSLIDSAANAETTSILKTAKNMTTYTAANKKALESVGITVGSDNKLSIDEDKFKEASKSRVQSLFQSTGGYAYQVSAKASNISVNTANLAKKVESSKTGKSTQSALKSFGTSSDSTKTLGTIEDAAESASKSLAKLLETGYKSKFNKVNKTDENGKVYMDYDKDAIYSAVKDFLKDYNTLLDKTEDSKTQSIVQARKTMINYAAANKSKLSDMGITIDSNNKISINEEVFKKADMSDVKSLFQDKGSFGKQLEQQISKIDMYAENEAAKSNTYNNDGNYTYNYNSGDWFNTSF